MIVMNKNYLGFYKFFPREKLNLFFYKNPLEIAKRRVCYFQWIFMSCRRRSEESQKSSC